MTDLATTTASEAISQLLREVADARLSGPGDKLRRDLGIDGRRAHRFMQAFADRFSVDMATYDHRRFFTAYDLDFGIATPDFTWLFLSINPGFRRAWNAAQTYEISVQHLAAVADRQSWFDPAPEPHSPPVEVSSPYWQRVFLDAWTMLVLPYRLFSLMLMAVIGWGVIYSLFAMARAAISQEWMGVLGAVLSGGVLAFWGAVILGKTARRIQARLGGD